LFSQERFPTLSQSEDSCFCLKYNEKEEVSRLIPDQTVEGFNLPIEAILLDLREQLLNDDLKDSIGYGRLAMELIVDEEGKLRCGIIIIGKNDVIAQKAFDILQQQQYKPAMVRGQPIIESFIFMLNKE
jgi:hypothetical protein